MRTKMSTHPYNIVKRHDGMYYSPTHSDWNQIHEDLKKISDENDLNLDITDCACEVMQYGRLRLTSTAGSFPTRESYLGD